MCTYEYTRAGKDKLEFVKIETDVGIMGLVKPVDSIKMKVCWRSSRHFKDF